MTPEERKLMMEMERRQQMRAPNAAIAALNTPEALAQQERFRADRQEAMQPRPQVGPAPGSRPPNPFVSGLSQLGRKALDYMQDPAMRARLAAGFQSMTLNPNQQFIQSQLQRSADIRAERQGYQQANMTADYFRKQGRPQLAAIIEDVPSVAPAALEALFKEPRAMSTFEQKLAAVKAANPNMPYSEVVDKVLSGEQPTTILKQMGTVPPGYKAEYDAQGNVTSLTPIPGGPAAQKGAETEQKNKRAFAVYEQAVAGMQKALGAAPTGYFAGMLPAITVGMQQLDAATQSFLPTLKDVFRGAGEGTFTEGDQQILTNLVPTRQDAPQVAAFKLEQLDRMVRIKLGQDPAPSSSDIDEEVPPVPEGTGFSQQEWRERWSKMTEQERNQFRRQQ